MFGLRPALVAGLTSAFKAKTGFEIEGEFGAVGGMADKLRAGVPTDMIILTKALVATRRLLDESEHATYADQFKREIEVQAEIRVSDDAKEGRNAFLEKRAARFSGR